MYLLSGDTLIQALGLLPTLVQSVEKASNQSTQVALVSEGVSAAAFLAKLSTADIQVQ